jgi:tetratricopeptide (TPR) repeat protein
MRVLRALLEAQEVAHTATDTKWMTTDDLRKQGQGWASLREWARAARAYERAAKLQPTGNDYFRIGYALSELADRAREPIPLLRRTIAAYEQALRLYKPGTTDYAGTQNNLGTAYGNLAAHRDPVENLDRAVAAYQEALKHRTPQTAPLDYAMTQNNLGNAYQMLAAHREPVENLDRAVAAYQEALKHRTPRAAPLDYAMTQNNLGIAYVNLAARGDPVKNLERAVAAFQEALRFFTAQAAPLRYANTQYELGEAYRNLATLQEPVSTQWRAVQAWAVSLVLLGRADHAWARFPARSLLRLRGERGQDAFQAIVTSAGVREALAPHSATPEEVLALVERFAAEAGQPPPGETGSSPPAPPAT